MKKSMEDRISKAPTFLRPWLAAASNKSIPVLCDEDNGHVAQLGCETCGGSGWCCPDDHYDDHCACRGMDDPDNKAVLRYDWATGQVVPRHDQGEDWECAYCGATIPASGDGRCPMCGECG